MTDDDTRLDARVRRAITALPTPDDAETHRALLNVLERSSGRRAGRPYVARRWGAPLAAAAAAVGVVAATVAVGALIASGPDQTPSPQGPAPDTLSGTWQRRVAPEAGLVSGRWTMTFRPDGVLALTGPAGAPSAEGASYSGDRSRIRVDAFVNNVCAELPAGTYEWKVAGSDLTLVRVDDPCPTRADLLAGTWSTVP